MIKTETCRRPHLQPKRLNMAPCANVSSVDKSLWQESPEATTNLEGLEASATASKQNPEMVQSLLNRKVVELSENETLLEVQVESVKNHLQGKQKALEDLPAANDRRGKVCTFCHTSGHNKTNYKRTPCYDVNSCKLKAKQPELLIKIRSLRRELKELEQKYAKV